LDAEYHISQTPAYRQKHVVDKLSGHYLLWVQQQR